MKPVFSFRNCPILAGPILSSLSVYFILSSLLLFPSDIAIPLSVILFSLLSGLSCYLLLVRDESSRKENRLNVIKENNNDSYNNSSHHAKDGTDKKNSASNLIFIAVYVLSIIIVGTSKPLGITGELFIAWNQLFASPTQIMQLVAAVLLSFFFPGYALVRLLVKVYPLESLPKLLLSFLFSMLIAGLSVYVAAIIIGVPAAYVNPIIIGVDVLVLVLFIIYIKPKKILSVDLDTIASFFSQSRSKFWMILTTKNISLFTIFVSLFALVVFYTCYLEKGVIVGDQWFHHGKSLLIKNGAFKDVSSYSDRINPPFFSALLAGFFSLSGVPSVNAYVSINCLNMMAIFAFYYFFTCWVPSNQRKAAVLSTILFVVSSGFGWVIVLDTSLTYNDQNSQQASLENLRTASIRSSDIRTPNTFINVGHPTFTSPLIIIGLPAGFVVLGLIKGHIGKEGKLRFICIITAITVLGILSHPEFYLFILVGSILILSFRLIYGNLTYASIMLAFFIGILIDFLSPQHFYTSLKMLNAPLLILCLVFVSIIWALYRTRILSKLYRLKSVNHSFLLTKFENFTSKNTTKIAVISVLAYLYLFTFVVLEALSIDDIKMQVGTSTQRNIPWYLYPMKFGVTGLLGLAFISSYLFKRFEKEIFVFGIIAVLALFAGPYYDEHRFSKYIMVGMVGFASLLFYKIILFLQRPNNDLRHHNSHSTTSQLKPLASSLLIGLVISSAALSVFMLAGYKALGYKNPLFQEDFFRIDFPSQSEMNLLNFFRADLPYLNSHFIAIQANDSQTDKILSELEGFSAIPRSRILQNPQSLNASSLEGLYSSLHNDNILYVILLKTDANRIEQILTPFHFAIDNFPRVYHDDKYIVLKVPDMDPPLSQRAVDTGLVYDKKYELPPLSTILNDTNSNEGSILKYNYKFFNNIENRSKFVNVENKENGVGIESKGNEKEILTLRGDKKAITVWSSPIKVQTTVNYVEGKFSLVAENKTRNDFGIRMEDETNNQQYYVSIDKDSLDLKQKSVLENMSNKERVLFQNGQMPLEQRAGWHTLKILVLKDTINVYFDDILKIKAPKSQFSENFSSISKIGITANKNIVRFEPLKIGYLSESALESYQKNNMRDTYYRHYYPLSALALSKLRYDTFIDGDSSVFSKNSVILTSDPILHLEGNETRRAEEIGTQDGHVISEEKFNRYLEFVKLGGTLIVMNPDSNIGNHSSSNKSELGAFSKLLSIRYGDKTLFDGIASDGEHNPLNKTQHNTFLNISGFATNINFSNSSGIQVKSYYVDGDKDKKSNYKTVAPFAIEKKYGKGKLVMLNIAGYFDALYKYNNQEFTTINDIPKLIELESDKHYFVPPPPKNTTIFANAKIVGDMKISNYTGINIKSNSLLIGGIDGRAPPYNLTINNISTSPHMQIYIDNKNYYGSLQQQDLNENSTKNQNNVFKNITIRDLKLYGPYEVIINSTDRLFHVSPTSSYYDYIAAAIPKGFDMLLHLSQGAYAEFTISSCTNNSYCQQQVRISDVGDIAFHNIKIDTPSVSSLPVYVKSPEIMINNGTVKFKLDSNSNHPEQPAGNIVANGNIVENFDRVETYNSFNKNGTKTDFVIYLKSLDIQGNYMRENKQSDMLRLPGDISVRAKDKGIGVPWEKTMMSFTSIIIMISIIVVVIALKYYLWPKIKQYKELYEK